MGMAILTQPLTPNHFSMLDVINIFVIHSDPSDAFQPSLLTTNAKFLSPYIRHYIHQSVSLFFHTSKKDIDSHLNRRNNLLLIL